VSTTFRMSVVVPSYRRPDYLDRCLDGLARQSRPAEEVVVVLRADDESAQRILSRHATPRLKVVSVGEGGVLAAMGAGMRAATGDVLAFTDDDAVPRPDWLENIGRLLEDRAVGAVGGRDVLHPPGDDQSPRALQVGRITRWGRVIGNHHLGNGECRDVRVLKAVNMAFRKEAARLPSALRGTGAQAHFEVAMCLWAQRRGWRLVYDPALVVDHYPAPRFDADQRGMPETTAVRAAAYNLVFCLLGSEPSLYWRRAMYGLLVGDRGAPGITRAIIAALGGEWTIVRNLIPSLEGQVQALVDVGRGRRPIADHHVAR
jgi:glycosyltransferase involved in cell wall biosynthesis